MKKYIFEITFYFLLPAILIAVIAEISLRKIPNDYAFKNEWLTKNSEELEVLALGASSIFHDFNPYYLEKSGFNAAHLSQSLKYDHFIFNKFIDQMPSLEYVIMGIDYWSPFGDIEESPEWWRVKYYNIHYGGNFYRWEGRYNYEIYFQDFSTFKRAANGFLTMLGIRNDTHISTNEKGYGIHYTLANRSADWDNGQFEALRHNALIDEAMSMNNRFDQNRKYVEDIILQSSRRGVKVLLVNVPLYQTYRDHLNSDHMIQQKEFCRYFEKNFPNVSYHDFSNDPRFTEGDFYDANHLNEKGTEKFTRIIDSIINSDTSRLLVESKFNKND